MTDEDETPPPVLSAVDIAVHTGGAVWKEGAGCRRGIELASLYPEVDPRSIAATISIPESNELDTTPATMLAEIQCATRRGWVSLPYDSPAFYGINTLVAWTLSAGSLGRDYTPYFGIRHGTDYERLDRAFERLQSRYERADADAQFTERVRPREAATSLGRVLATLGVPIEPPTEGTTLPAYLHDCPPPLQRAFSHTYLNNRARYSEGKLPACERRSPVFRRELGAFLSHTEASLASDTESLVRENDRLD